MKVSSVLFFTTLLSGGLALSIDTNILKSLHLRSNNIEDRAVEEAAAAAAPVAPADILNPVVRPRECEEPAEPEEPSEEERRKGAKRPKRPSRPSNC